MVNKPGGLPMHPTLDNLYENLVSGFNRKLFVTHRLDVPTSGLVVIAKTAAYQSLFNNVISGREIEKTYQALTLKQVTMGLKKHFMKVSERAPKEVTLVEPSQDNLSQWDECLLEVLECRPTEFKAGIVLAPGYEAKVRLLTGRTHQIRVHAAYIKHPIVGDLLYTGPRKLLANAYPVATRTAIEAAILALNGQALHAYSLSFDHPRTHERLAFTVPLPAVMQDLLDLLR